MKLPFFYDFKAGDSGIYDYMRNAGCDSMGFLTGAIGMTDEITDKVLGYEAKNAGLNNRIYAEYTEFDEVKESEEELYESVQLQKSRFELYEIEKISVIITEYSDIRAGDILVNNQYSTSPVAIVTEVAEEVKGMDDVTVVYIEELSNGTAKEGKWSELPEADNYTARRLLKSVKSRARVMSMASDLPESNNTVTPASSNSSVTPEELNYNSSLVNTGSIKIKNMKEESSSEDKWRWIPNTGEFLEIEIGSITLKNKAGVQIRNVLYKADIIAKDRNYDSTKANKGNIYNNTSEQFEIRLKNTNGYINYSYLNNQVKNVNSGVYESKEDYHQIQVNSNRQLFLNSTTGLQLVNNKRVENINKIYIRPENAANFRPGDDLILGLKLTFMSDYIKRFYVKDNSEHVSDLIEYTTGQEFDPIYFDSKDYIATYDKKALWRANLYIDEGGNDWNINHPWDVPASSGIEGPKWWTAETWGFNEWNRKYELNSNSGQMIFNPGNGEQVVNFSINDGWTPVRHPQNYSSLKTNSVAYDYPDGISTTAKDSPFDFIFKMNNQKKSIRKYFSSINPKKDKAKIPTGRKDSNQNEIFIEIETSDNSLANWNNSVAPENKWSLYHKEPVDSINAYIPGLGLYFHSKSYTESLAEQFNFNSKKSAGTDCVGFVKRTTSYQNIFSDESSRETSRIYKWGMLEEDRAEKYGKSEYNTYDPDSIGRATQFPVNSNSTIILDMDLIIDLIDEDINNFNTNYESNSIQNSKKTEFKKLKQLFLSIVPGDIIQYTPSGEGHHIGEIDSIAYETISNAKTLNQIFQAVSVVESVYSGYYCEVLKRNLRQSNPDSASNQNNTYSWIFSNEINIDRLRELEIRRLK